MKTKQRCKGCRKDKDYDLNLFKQCDDCRERAKIMRENKKNKIKIDDYCVSCVNKKVKTLHLKSKDNLNDVDLGKLKVKNVDFINDYCKTHFRDLQARIDVKNKIRRCNQNGCHGGEKNLPSIINNEDINIKRCQDCRTKSNLKDKERRDSRRENTLLLTELGSDERLCIKCGDSYKFTDENKTQRCIKCKGYSDKVDKKRRATPEYKVKQQLRDRIYYYFSGGKEKKYNYKKINHDRLLDMERARKLRLRLEDEEAYLKKNAEQARKYRQSNNWKEYYKHYTSTIKYRLDFYKKRSKKKNIVFELTDEQFKNYCEDICFYCKEPPKKDKFNGIDRCNNDLGYTVENCVTACTMCNMMKAGLTKEVFILKAIHIICYMFGLSFFDNKNDYLQFPGCFNNYKGCSYSDYKTRANKKNDNSEDEFEFNLSLDEFIEITENDCFYCGKESCDEHGNGVDRINNDIGYTLDNCESCCGDCNFMKKDYNIDDFIHKLSQIYSNHAIHYIKYIDYILTKVI